VSVLQAAGQMGVLGAPDAVAAQGVEPVTEHVAVLQVDGDRLRPGRCGPYTGLGRHGGDPGLLEVGADVGPYP
jgi:hypothetical protein